MESLFFGGPWGRWGPFGSKELVPREATRRASRDLGDGKDFAGENHLRRRAASSVLRIKNNI